jgi:hypothetical protein
MDLREIGWGGMDWIDMVQDREQWRALTNKVINVWVPKHVGKFLSNWWVLEKDNSMELVS